jgi:hypothetical protein
VISADEAAEDHDAVSAFVDLYTDDVILRWQDRDWPWGGDMECPPEFWDSNFPILDEERLLWWWRSRGETLRGEKMSNSGATIHRYDRDRICEHWEYTDTQYVAHVFRGWRDGLDLSVRGAAVGEWAVAEDPPYSRTDDPM